MSFVAGVWGEVIGIASSLIAVVLFYVPLPAPPQPLPQPQVPIKTIAASSSSVTRETVAQQEANPPAVKGLPGIHSPDTQFIAATTTGPVTETYLTDRWGDKITPPYCGTFDSWTADSKEVKIFAPDQCGYDLSDQYYYLTVKGIGKTLEGASFLPATILVPFDPSVFFNEASPSAIIKNTYTSSSTDAVITFGDPPKDDETVNAGFEVYLNQKHIGEVGGETVDLIGFSPNSSYFAIRTGFNGGCVAQCRDFQLSLIDVRDGRIISVRWPASTSTVRADIPKAFVPTIPTSEAYTWINDDTLQFIFYTVVFYDGEDYRVSPKQVWDYSIASGQYTLVQTFSE